MNKKICINILLLFSLTTALAKELKYPVNEIPANLKENAHTVMRIYQQEVEIKSEKSATITITEVRTILNKNGEENSYFRETYDPMDKITGLKGKVYDEQGKQIRSFGSDDIIDRSSISGFSMYEDNRVKIIDPKCKTFPFTVEYTYQIDSKQTLFFPAWTHGSEHVSYENSSYTVKAPAGYGLRYKEYNLSKGVVKTNQDGKDVYTWTLNNLKARIDEPMSSVITPDYPLVLIAPSSFAFAETKGSAESWKELGKWATTLIEGRDKLPETTIIKIKEIVKDCKTNFDKVKKIYEYMQQKTRYVNVSVGIGGWQPFDAMVVDKFSYGDCKALSNYTKALLSAVGINSYYTLVKAGTESNCIDESFPSSHFNHVIVCVPLSKDTVWLECTNQRMPCGYNGDFTDDRLALLVDGENSKLVRTRAYSATENCTERHSNINLIDEQSATAEVKTIYKGLTYDNILPAYYADDADKKKIVTQSIQLPSFSLDQFSYKENKNVTPSFEENLTVSCTNYIHKLANDVALLPVNFMNKLKSIPEKIRNRKTEMCIRRPEMEIDTTVYKLPAEYQATELPEKSEISSKFGKSAQQLKAI